MTDIQAFRGIRYDLGHVGSLSDVIAPPYDVISPEFQDELYDKHPANCIRLILNREEPGDDDASNRYSRAARFLKNWQNEGVLQTEPDPAIYVYHQQFEYAGQQFTRRGFMSRVRLEPFGEGNIYPHEETHSAAKADRLKLFHATKTNLSQIFGIYPDQKNTAQEILEAEIVGRAPLEATDHLGVVHRLWPVTDVKVISEASAAMGPQPMYIADGHHRYETGCNYRQELLDAGELDPNHPANFVLMMCVSMHDPGMIVLPTHRLFRGIPALTSEELVAKLGDCFTTRVAGEGSDLAHTIWESIETDDDQGTLGLFTSKDERWTVATVTEQGKARLAELATDRSSDWQGLGVSILHKLLVDTLLGAAGHPKPKYVHLVDEVVEGLDQGDDGEAFPLAALVMPATLEHIRLISQHGERMPAKSTYFYPKLLSGLVFNPLA
ncbi:MAG TPA: DUF1015 domain-containing protein [Planctomycetaceae bacterium]|nr:phosphatase [Blastopirellula sp.]HAY79441.1 DUF1015 domain-containing protein [Planctomycetaceae bacterium]